MQFWQFVHTDSLYTNGNNESWPKIAETFHKEQNFPVWKLGEKSERKIFGRKICFLFYSTNLGRNCWCFGIWARLLLLTNNCWRSNIRKKRQLSEILAKKDALFLKNKSTKFFLHANLEQTYNPTFVPKLGVTVDLQKH